MWMSLVSQAPLLCSSPARSGVEEQRMRFLNTVMHDLLGKMFNCNQRDTGFLPLDFIAVTVPFLVSVL